MAILGYLRPFTYMTLTILTKNIFLIFFVLFVILCEILRLLIIFLIIFLFWPVFDRFLAIYLHDPHHFDQKYFFNIFFIFKNFSCFFQIFSTLFDNFPFFGLFWAILGPKTQKYPKWDFFRKIGLCSIFALIVP